LVIVNYISFEHLRKCITEKTFPESSRAGEEIVFTIFS
jgi:hypothetical protein